jgi:DNA-binding MarR family transcriptional regulator
MKKELQKEGLVENILNLTDRAFQELLPILPKEWLHLNLTMPQLKVVLLLYMNGACRMSEIASALGVSLATATGVLDRLVERDIVRREGQPDDRRVVLCRLSDKGEQLISGLWQLSRIRLGELMSALAPSQLVLITDALEAILQAGEAVQGDWKEAARDG